MIRHYIGIIVFVMFLCSGTLLSQPISITFNYTSSSQNWVVPTCVTSISVSVAGASGGGYNGGYGAFITGNINVTPGQTLQIKVGGEGSCPNAGYNGGGLGASANTSANGGCGGGGATDIRVSPYQINNRIIVAAGGGGMGGGDTDADGGEGGCIAGATGTSPFGVGGSGGSQTSGGSGGPPWIPSGNYGNNGSLGTGGNGAIDPCYNVGPGGGGGGGYYGGGGGGSDCYANSPLGGGGGGGGSSLIPAGFVCTPNSNNTDGYVIITYSTSSTSNITTLIECDSYTWPVNGVIYTTSGSYIDVSTNAAGCTHTETLNLTITSSTSNITTLTECDSYTWPVNGVIYTTSGSYTDVSTNAAGCTHTETLDLTITSSTSNTTTLTECDSYIWPVNGTIYTISGSYIDVSTNAAGCTHTETLNLTLNNSTSASMSATACDSYTWPVNGVIYTTSGSYIDVSTNAAGCTHTETLNLTINNSTSNITTLTECDSYTWPVNGVIYTTSGSYTDVSTNAAGCTHTETLDLTITSSTSNTTTLTECDSYIWPVNGTIYTISGSYIDVSTNAAGCTHTETLNLTLNNSTSASMSATACDSYTWPVNGVIYTTSGSYIDVSTNAAGCTHTETLNLTINNSTSNITTLTECDSYTWPVNGVIYTTSGSYTDVSTNAAGCTHTETLDLTITSSTSNTTTLTECDSYIWPVNGTIYTISGSYIDVSTNAAGCTHTETLNLTLNNSTSASMSATACDSYTWPVNGVIYTTSGSYIDVSTNAAGCTHTETLNLTINNSTSNITTLTECDSYTWPVNGVIYTTSGSYTDVSTNAAGCTHTETLDLTITSSTSNTTTLTECDSYIWPVNGTIYTISGSYIDVSTNAAGCTHTETLNLTLNNSTSASMSATACDSYTWPVNGVIYTTSGSYIDVSTNAAGCTHMETLNLTINQLPIVDLLLNDICVGDSSFCINTGTPSGGSYFIDNVNTDFFDVENMEVSTYNIRYEYTDSITGCFNTISKDIQINKNPYADFAFGPQPANIDDPEVYFENRSDFYNYQLWNLGDGTIINQDEFSHIFSDTGSFFTQLYIENEYGCSDSVTYEIIIYPVFAINIPSAFTPNDDGDNDNFAPVLRDGGFKSYNMKIYDRWGGIIYNEDNGKWDGSLNNNSITSGVYSYSITVLDFKDKPFTYTGIITLIK